MKSLRDHESVRPSGSTGTNEEKRAAGRRTCCYLRASRRRTVDHLDHDNRQCPRPIPHHCWPAGHRPRAAGRQASQVGVDRR